jgi:hypothetical protein
VPLFGLVIRGRFGIVALGGQGTVDCVLSQHVGQMGRG